jgi:hypothetical protein
MFAFVAVVLIFAWLLGYLVFPVGGSLIHLLLIVAVVALAWHLLAGRPRRSA